MKKQFIKKSFLIRFIVILVCIVALAIVVFFALKNVHSTDAYTKKVNSVISTLYQSETGHYKWVIDLRESIVDGVAFTGSKDATKCTLGEHIYSDEVQNNPDLTDLVSKIEPLHLEIHTLANQALDMAQTDKAGAQKMYETTIMPDVQKLTGLLDDAIASRQETVKQADLKLSHVVELSIALVIFFIIVALLACFNLYIYVKKQIVKPILHIAKTANQLAEGQLDLDFTVSARNEINDLGQVLNSSVKDISTYIWDIDRAMGELAKGNFNVNPSQPFVGDFLSIETSITHFIMSMCDTLHTIGQSSKQVSSNAEQIAYGAQALAQGATQQASSTSELANTVRQISVHIHDTAENSEETSNLVGLTGEKIRVCNEQMEQLLAAMSEITEKSGEIGKIIKTIQDIAFQTNILALNAAVEASRAGTAGKGFAVVADEVRSLAKRSADAAKNTTQLIEDTVDAVGHGEKLAELTASSLLEVVEGTRTVTDRIQNIIEATKEQTQSASQITSGIEQISTVVQANSITAQESAAASEELSGQAVLLKELVGRFVLHPKCI